MCVKYWSKVIWLSLLYCLLLAISKSAQSDEAPATSMAELKAKFDKTEKFVRIQNKVTAKFLTYMPTVHPISPTSEEFVDVKLLEDDSKLQEPGMSQTWILRETLGFPYTKNASFTRLYSIRPSEMDSAPGTQKSIREFSNSRWKIDLIGEDSSGRPFYRLKNTFSQDCLTPMAGPNITNIDLKNAVERLEFTVQSKVCPQDGVTGADDNSLFFLRFQNQTSAI